MIGPFAVENEGRGNVIELSSQYHPITTSRYIRSFFRERVAVLDDSRSIGDALKGSELGEFWKYRVGDWRLICEIRDKQILITVLSLGNLCQVYR